MRCVWGEVCGRVWCVWGGIGVVVVWGGGVKWQVMEWMRRVFTSTCVCGCVDVWVCVGCVWV